MSRNLTQAERAFIDSLYGEDLQRPAQLIKELNALDKRPSDFA